MANNLLVNIHTNMLILGKAATNFARKEVYYAEDYEAVLEAYGDSELTRAFKQAKEFGAPHIFLLNLQKDQDYFDIIETIKQNDFTYLVFASLMLSDTFQDVAHGGKIHSFFAYILGSMGSYHNSTFIVTDKHASLYENVDSFLEDMRSVQNNFYQRCTERANLGNIIFVANNLENYKMASVPLAAMLCSAPINKYPLSKSYGKAIFRIDQWDEPGDMAYFRSDPARETTVENLLNCRHDCVPEKVVFIDRILKYLRREMDFTQFKGRMYTSYQKLLFNQMLTEYLNSIKGFIITDYEIKSIEAYKDMPGTVVMVARLEIVPVNCLERCSLSVEAEV